MNNTPPLDLFNYTYAPDAKVEITGTLFYALMQVLNQTKIDNTYTGLAYDYASKVKKVKKDGVDKIEIELQKHPSALSYFEQPQLEFTTMLGNLALDLLMIMQGQHSENIKNGIAKPHGEFEEKPVIKL